MPKKRTFWPYGILISILSIVCACVATVIFASNYPVYEDDFYFDKYQNVKDNYAEIEKAQKKFDALFEVTLDLNSSVAKKKRIIYNLENNTSKVRFVIQEKGEDTQALLQANLLLTRPHISKQDIELNTTLSEDPATLYKKSFHRYFLDTTLPPLEKGRWQLKLKLTNDIKYKDNANAIGFFIYELNSQ